MVALLDSLRPNFTSMVVMWSYLIWDGRILTLMGHVLLSFIGRKLSTGNPGPSTIEFCVRDSSGDPRNNKRSSCRYGFEGRT